MRSDGDPVQRSSYEWSEGSLKYTSDPQIVNHIPAPCDTERDMEARLDAQDNLSAIVSIFFGGDGVLSKAAQEVRQKTVEAFQMYYRDNTPVRIIAQKFGCDGTTVYRYIAKMRIMLRHVEKMCLELKDRLDKMNDWKSLQVLHYIRIGKHPEQMIRLSQQEPFSYYCTDSSRLSILLKIVPGAEIKGEPSNIYIQWHIPLSREDVEESAFVRIPSLSDIILKEIEESEKEES